MKDVVINNRKVAIVGCGFVGSATAFCLMQSGQIGRASCRERV